MDSLDTVALNSERCQYCLLTQAYFVFGGEKKHGEVPDSRKVTLRSLAATSLISPGSVAIMDSPDDTPCGYVCTHAITGSNHPAYQSIYVCETCRLSDDGRNEIDAKAFCICECCAEVCHANHKVEFVGMGPCTCDCSRLCSDDAAGESSADQMSYGRDIKSAAVHPVCKLAEVSREEAIKLGFETCSRKLNDPIPIKIPPVCTLLPSSSDPDLSNSDDASVPEPSSELLTATQCIDCNSTMRGYTIDSFKIPSLSSSLGFDQCRNVICQAEALVQESRDTFWVPIDDSGEAIDNDEQLSDLELLAKEIYLRHTKAYNLHTRNIDVDLHQSTNRFDSEASIPGAEWWVQVKAAGSDKTPVDLHYDKDEALAEAFCIGSFPTLSTVTYLTGESMSSTKDDGQSKGGMDTVPTVVFPHTYHDEEDRPISSMLLSRPVRGKHLVFDGRLLHGAPGHPALRLNQRNGAAAPPDAHDVSPLRVTFLVNIWRTGRPANVKILPSAIRTKIQSTTWSREKSLYDSPLEFEKRPIPQYFAPSKLSLAFSAENTMDTQIILPFVSTGATWISDDEAEDATDNKGSNEDGQSIRMKSDANEDGSGDDDNEEEEADELFLCLPQFTTSSSEYLDDGADTATFLFQIGNEARLVRRRRRSSEQNILIFQNVNICY